MLGRRITRYLQRREHLPREAGDEVSPPEPEEPLLAELAAASIQGRVALGAKRGAAVARLRGVSAVRPLSVPGQLCCDVDGFSLHAKVEVGERDRERLAALVPRARTHLVTYHGVPAPAAAWRDLVVPGSPSRLGTSPCTPRQRLTWAELLERVFAIDVLTCPNCGGPRKLIALINDELVVRKILAHLGLPTEPPPMAPARAPPEPEFAWVRALLTHPATAPVGRAVRSPPASAGRPREPPPASHALPERVRSDPCRETRALRRTIRRRRRSGRSLRHRRRPASLPRSRVIVP